VFLFEDIPEGLLGIGDALAIFIGSLVESGYVIPGIHAHSHVHSDGLSRGSGKDDF
jgi:hypothetical protein